MSDGCIDRCTQLGVVNNAVAGTDSRLLRGFLVSSSSFAGSVLVWGFHRELELWEVFVLTVRHLSSGIALGCKLQLPDVQVTVNFQGLINPLREVT
jgi:hypothetical protein